MCIFLLLFLQRFFSSDHFHQVTHLLLGRRLLQRVRMFLKGFRQAFWCGVRVPATSQSYKSFTVSQLAIIHLRATFGCGVYAPGHLVWHMQIWLLMHPKQAGRQNEAGELKQTTAEITR